MATGNSSRALETVARIETQRRLTVTVIALRRYHLRNGCFPAALDALVPEFVLETPIDPMSGKPFCYRRNADRSFTLYSVGKNGQDDGGDATAVNPTKRCDLWSGRDAVWPTAVTHKTDLEQ
jgi:hypothetical protein